MKEIETEVAPEDMQIALVLDPKQWRTYNELAKICNKRGEFLSALNVTEKRHEIFMFSII